jgi:hypothetical protein
MAKNEIIDGICKIRETEAAKYNFDVRAIMEAAMRRQKKHRRKIVSFVTKRKTA